MLLCASVCVTCMQGAGTSFEAMAHWSHVAILPASGSCQDAWLQFTFLMDDLGVPLNYRHMEGFGVHTFTLINREGKINYVKFHWQPTCGVCLCSVIAVLAASSCCTTCLSPASQPSALFKVLSSACSQISPAVLTCATQECALPAVTLCNCRAAACSFGALQWPWRCTQSVLSSYPCNITTISISWLSLADPRSNFVTVIQTVRSMAEVQYGAQG